MITSPATYKRFILQAFRQRGTLLDLQVILHHVYENMKDRLTSADHKPSKGNCLVWRNRAQWALQQLKKEGLVDRGPVYQTWQMM